MSIEKRLADHMAEQADHLTFPPADPTRVTDAPGSGKARAVTAMVAIIVVAIAGLGFVSLSRDDGSSEIAAGEAEDSSDDPDHDDSADDTTGGGGEGRVGSGPVSLSIEDTTDDNSPGSGRVVVDGGVYYVLSTAPGRVQINSEADVLRLGRPNTFYTYDGDGGWQANEIDDRFVSDFAIDDGVIYVLSTGTRSGGEAAAFGTSDDRGRSWDWQDLSELPPASSVGMLPLDDSTIILASRWGHADWDQGLKLARNAGYDVSHENLRDLSHDGFAYYEVDRSDPCSVFMANYGLHEFVDWIRSTSEDEQEMAREDLRYIEEDAAQAGCEIDLDDLDSLEAASPTQVRWADLGITAPESWTPWVGLYRLQDGQLSELDHPFGDQQIQYITVRDGQLLTSTYRPPTIVDGTTRDEPEGETRWSTTNGVDWTDEFFSYDAQGEEECCYGDPFFGTPMPVAGDSTFRVFWNEPDEEDIIAFEQAMEEASTEEEAMEAEMQFSQLWDGAGQLQRSVSGGPWENVDLERLGVDGHEYVPSQVQGTAFGVFVHFRPGPRMMEPESMGSLGSLVAYTNNGHDWTSFETDGDWLDLHDGANEILAFDHRWVQNAQGGRQETRALLLTPGG